MTVRFRIFAFAATAPLVVACTALLGDFDSSEDTSSVSYPDGAVSDSTVIDSTTVVETDAQTVDGGAELFDATAGDAADSGSTWTRLAYLTFDDGGIPANWVQTAPRVAITDAASSSRPYSAVATGSDAYLKFGLFEGGVGTIRMSAKVRVPQLPDGAKVVEHYTLRVGLTSGGSQSGTGTYIALVATPGADPVWTTVENSHEARGNIAVTPNAFVNVSVQFQYIEDGGMFVTAAADGTSLPGQPWAVTFNPLAPPDGLFAGFGAPEGYEGVYYDDVIIEISPNP